MNGFPPNRPSGRPPVPPLDPDDRNLANEPDLAWGGGRFTTLFPELMALFTAAYPHSRG